MNTQGKRSGGRVEAVARVAGGSGTTPAAAVHAETFARTEEGERRATPATPSPAITQRRQPQQAGKRKAGKVATLYTAKRCAMAQVSDEQARAMPAQPRPRRPVVRRRYATVLYLRRGCQRHHAARNTLFGGVRAKWQSHAAHVRKPHYHPFLSLLPCQGCLGWRWLGEKAQRPIRR